LALPLVLLLACAQAPPPPPYASIATERGEVFVRLEIAETEEARRRGLMHRDALASDSGMVFLWPQDTASAFHMRDTNIPLSIAFFAADGRILRILDMEPCRADPCPIYEAEVQYRGALEVNRGAFARWGVGAGARLLVVR